MLFFAFIINYNICKIARALIRISRRYYGSLNMFLVFLIWHGIYCKLLELCIGICFCKIKSSFRYQSTKSSSMLHYILFVPFPVRIMIQRECVRCETWCFVELVQRKQTIIQYKLLICSLSTKSDTALIRQAIEEVI